MLHFHLTSPHHPIRDDKTRPAYHCVSILPWRRRSASLRGYVRLGNDVHASSMTLSHQPCPAVYFALSYLLSGTGFIRGPRLMKYFWRVLHGTGRKTGTRLVLRFGNLWPRAAGWRPGSSLRQRYLLMTGSGVSVVFVPIPFLHVGLANPAFEFFIARWFPRMCAWFSVRLGIFS